MISDHPGASRIRRRRFLGGAAALSLGGLALSAAATARGFEYGILGRAAPEFEVDYWLDRNGERLPTTMLNYRTGGTPWMIVIEPGGTVAYNDYHINGDKFIELLKKELG